MKKAVLCFVSGSVFFLLLLSMMAIKSDGQKLYMNYYCFLVLGLGIAWFYNRFKKPWILFFAPFMVLALPLPRIDYVTPRQQQHLVRLREEIAALSSNIPPETCQEINRKIYLEMRGASKTNTPPVVTNTIPHE